MKWLVVPLATFLVAFVSCCPSKPVMTYGGEAGADFSNEHSTYMGNSSTTGGVTSLRLGGLLNWSWCDQFELESGLQYGKRGGTDDGSTICAGYLNIPIRAHYFFSNFGLYGGAQPGFLLSAKDKYSGMTTDIKDQFQGFNLEAVGGVEYRFRMGGQKSPQLRLFGEYNLDLNNNIKGEPSYGGEAKAKWRNAGVGVRVLF